jgi:hypothetical protein
LIRLVLGILVKKNPAEAGLKGINMYFWVLGEPAASVVVRSTEHDSDDSQIDSEMGFFIKVRNILKSYAEPSNEV